MPNACALISRSQKEETQDDLEIINDAIHMNGGDEGKAFRGFYLFHKRHNELLVTAGVRNSADKRSL